MVKKKVNEMRKLLDKTLCEICQSIQMYEKHCEDLKRNELNSWKFWVRWRAVSKLRFLGSYLSLLYRQKLRILDLMDKYETDPLS